MQKLIVNTGVPFCLSFTDQALNSQRLRTRLEGRNRRKDCLRWGVFILCNCFQSRCIGAACQFCDEVSGLSGLLPCMSGRTTAKGLEVSSVLFQLNCLSESTSSRENFRTQKCKYTCLSFSFCPGPHWEADWNLAISPASFPIQVVSPTPTRKKRLTLSGRSKGLPLGT